MNRLAEITGPIQRFIIKQFPLARKLSNLEDDSPLFQSGIIDSLGVMDLIVFIEKEFRISIFDEDLLPENFDTIASMATFIQAKKAAN